MSPKVILLMGREYIRREIFQRIFVKAFRESIYGIVSGLSDYTSHCLAIPCI